MSNPSNRKKLLVVLGFGIVIGIISGLFHFVFGIPFHPITFPVITGAIAGVTFAIFFRKKKQ